MLRVGLFDSYQFFNDMLADPGAYLNGTVAPNITGAIHTCVFRVNESDTGPSNCTTVTGPAMDSYFWWVFPLCGRCGAWFTLRGQVR